MNKQRRKQISFARNFITAAERVIFDVKLEEELSLLNIPDNLRDTDKYYDAEDAYEELNEAYQMLHDANVALCKIEDGVNGV